jgi:hypothetical protein
MTFVQIVYCGGMSAVSCENNRKALHYWLEHKLEVTVNAHKASHKNQSQEHTTTLEQELPDDVTNVVKQEQFNYLRSRIEVM